jgi:predicted RNA polymerase sigma factor
VASPAREEIPARDALVRVVRAVDILRRERGRGVREAAAMDLLDPAGDVPPPDSVVRDDLLRLVFTCCHPSLSLEAQAGLSLRTLCGLSTAEVARALLSPSRPWSSG